MNEPTPRPGPPAELVHKVELIISNILRGGVILSLFLITCGTTLSFVHHTDYLSTPSDTKRLINSKTEFPHTLKETLAGVRDDRGQAVIVVGLLVLIATPVIRVGVSIVAFVIEKDAIFVALTTLVFALLLLSFFLGKAGG
jgi:uncharacterized membrane protein